MSKKLVKIDSEAHQMLKTLSYRMDREMGEIASECIRDAYQQMIEGFKERENDPSTKRKKD